MCSFLGKTTYPAPSFPRLSVVLRVGLRPHGLFPVQFGISLVLTLSCSHYCSNKRKQTKTQWRQAYHAMHVGDWRQHAGVHSFLFPGGILDSDSGHLACGKHVYPLIHLISLIFFFTNSIYLKFKNVTSSMASLWNQVDLFVLSEIASLFCKTCKDL